LPSQPAVALRHARRSAHRASRPRADGGGSFLPLAQFTVRAAVREVQEAPRRRARPREDLAFERPPRNFPGSRSPPPEEMHSFRALTSSFNEVKPPPFVIERSERRATALFLREFGTAAREGSRRQLRPTWLQRKRYSATANAPRRHFVVRRREASSVRHRTKGSLVVSSNNEVRQRRWAVELRREPSGAPLREVQEASRSLARGMHSFRYPHFVLRRREASSLRHRTKGDHAAPLFFRRSQNPSREKTSGPFPSRRTVLWPARPSRGRARSDARRTCR